MNVGDVMDELKVALEMAGYRSFAWPVPTVTPPAAIVTYPDEILYDATYGRGMDEITIPVVVVFGRPTDRATRDLYAAATSGAAGSIKAHIDGAAYTSCSSARVERVTSDVATIGGIDYLAALVTVKVRGRGTA